MADLRERCDLIVFAIWQSLFTIVDSSWERLMMRWVDEKISNLINISFESSDDKEMASVFPLWLINNQLFINRKYTRRLKSNEYSLIDDSAISPPTWFNWAAGVININVRGTSSISDCSHSEVFA